MTEEISYQNTDGRAGQWPVQARTGNTRLVFDVDWQPGNLRWQIAKQQAGRFLNFVLALVGIFGLGALVMQFVSPVLDMWWKVFLFTVLFDIWFWTRLVNSYGKKQPVDNIDLKSVFDKEALQIFYKALLVRGDKQADGVHLFLQILASKQAQIIFYRLGLGYRQLAQALLPLADNIQPAPPAISQDLAQLPFQAFALMKKLGAAQITPAILFAALAQLPQSSLTSRVFSEYAIKPEAALRVVAWQTELERLIEKRRQDSKLMSLKPSGDINRAMTSLPTPVLNRFSTDLTLRAHMGRLPFLLGRQQDLQNIFSAFEGQHKTVLLVGEAGVGKTSLIEMIAQKMLAEQVPAELFDKRLVRLEFAQIVGQAEEAGHALTAALNDAIKGQDIVLVVENIHEWGQSQVSGVSLYSVLLSAIQEAGLPMIATTTPAQFQSTPALQSNTTFERINIEEMSFEDAVLVASIEASALEGRHKLFWTYEAVEAAVKLSSQFMSQQRQPSASIKVMEVLSERVNSKDVKVVGEDDVRRIVSEISRVNVENTGAEESANLLNLEQDLHQRIIGQDQAVKAVASAMRRIKANVGDRGSRPLASFLFVGPTGVGKTELAKALADLEFGSQELMIRLDLSEFNLPESVTRLLGDRTHVSSFVSQVRERPYCVLLLDELEKAHMDVQNVFLQVMDEGHLTDNAGNKLDLTNTIIIATSNAAANEIKQGFESGTEFNALQSRLTHEVLVNYFRPEFLNRFDDIVLFKPLSVDEVGQIVKIQLDKLAANLSEQGIGLKIEEEGLAKIAVAAYDPQFGARPLKRYIQENVENKIADWILAKQIQRQDTVILKADGTLSH